MFTSYLNEVTLLAAKGYVFYYMNANGGELDDFQLKFVTYGFHMVYKSLSSHTWTQNWNEKIDCCIVFT